MKLAELEHYFATVATSTSGPPANLERVFKASPRLAATELLRIYNRGYHYRLLGALASVFAGTQRALGDAEFERLGLLYLARHPSEHPAIERVGRLFAEFLRSEATVPGATRDLAALEWARLCALVAPNPAAIAAANAVDVSTFPSSSLSFVPSLQTVFSTTEALALFEKSVVILPDPELRAVAVWRQGELVRHQALGALELEALTLAQAGASVSRICGLFDTGSSTDDTERAFGVIFGWFSREWIERSAPSDPSSR